MTPVTNKPPMPQAPGKGIKSFPTPVIDDVVITEIVNAWKGDYKALDYGVKWDEAPHASMQGSHPDHKLVFQDPASEDGEWIKRIWVNDRVNQDSYNYAIKYSGGSQSHPIYIRTYVLPREGYVPLPDLTPDDVYPTALLVEEEVQRNEGELDSKYIKVVRVFETLQGPEISSLRYNERGDLEEVISQQVSPDTLPDSDGLLVTQSQVIKEDVSKGTKTTATVPSHSTLTSKEKKEGLLGETTITDDIVDPLTPPDALSTNVISSSVEQTSKTKARKRTVTSSGPTSLSKYNKDGKLLGDTTLTKSIVSPSTFADDPSTLILSSEVDQIDSGKSIKTNIVLNSTPTLSGNKITQGLLGTTTTEEKIVPSGSLADSLTINIVSSQVEPIDSVRSKKTTETSSGPMSLSGGSSKQGLLGESEIIEMIVPAGSKTDELSINVISSEITPIDSAKSKKTTVTSNGPLTLSGKNNKEGLLGNTISVETIVSPNSSIDALSTTVISSEITPIDSAKSKKTTITSTGPTLFNNKSFKSGLLGETTITEEIVSPSTLPDELSINVISSEVTQIDSGKSKKTTVTSTNPTSLLKGSNDGKLFGNTKTIKSIVSPTLPPDAPSTSILSSEVDQIDNGKAIKTNVLLISTPILKGSKKSQGLLGETITQETVVSANTVADNLTLNIVSSQVEPIDSVRSKKTTETSNGPMKLVGDVKKQGLLGITSISETIVPAGSYADDLSKSIISSEVTPIDSAKSKKTTVTARTPFSLKTTTLASTPLGLVSSKKEESIVDTKILPEGKNTVLSDDITSIDEYKNKRETITVDAWPTLKGVDYDQTLNIGLFYDKQIINPNEYKNLTNVDFDGDPLDEWKTLKKRYDISQIQSSLESQYYKIETSVNIQLPNKLIDVIAYFGLSNGAGIDSSTAAGAGDSYNYSISGSARSSSAVSGDLYFKVQKGFSGSVPATEHIFFIKTNNGISNSITNNSILEIINNYNQFGTRSIPSRRSSNGEFISYQGKDSDKYKNWPNIRMISENVVLIGGSKSESKGKSQSASMSLNGSSTANSQNTSYDVNVSANSITVPETLHGVIPISKQTVGSLGSITVPYSVNPPTLQATTPEVFPTGNYLISSNVSLYKFGYAKVSAITVVITSDYV